MGAPQWDHFRLRIPMKIGKIVQEVAVARWSRTLSSLTSAGVPLLLALDITGRTGGNVAIEEAMEGVIASVKARWHDRRAAGPSADLPGDGHAHGRSRRGNGCAGCDCSTRSRSSTRTQVEASVKALTSILEPIMIIVIGGIVGFIVISMYLPLFSVYNSIK